MLPSVLSLLCLVQFAQAAVVTNTTTTGCPSCDTTPCNYRSVWSILGSCALTLLICVWHAIHPNPHPDWFKYWRIRLSMMLCAFFVPEALVYIAFDEWQEAKKTRNKFYEKGYGWWTMTHSYFVCMGGFSLCNNEGTKSINSEELLSLLQAGDILNPDVTKEDIMDKSTSDGLLKAIFVVQLLWFAIQFIVRLANHLSVTLVELDTVCIALLTLALLSCWWGKPCCPRRPYVFYHRNLNNSGNVQEKSKEKQDSEGLSHTPTERKKEWSDLLDPLDPFFVLFLTWALFGALHAIAWNYAFPTEIERIFWRVASLALAGGPLFLVIIIAIIIVSFKGSVGDLLGKGLIVLYFFISIMARVCLVALMLASLRSLPASAREMILWTQYIPHL